mgnify:CR=1 FL=1
MPKGVRLTPTERSTGALNQPAELYEAANLLRPGELVYRRPIHYAPPSSARVNLERLPPVEQMADMQLAYREQTLSTPSLIQSARTHLNTILYLTLGLAAGVGVVNRIVPAGVVPIIASVVSVLWLLYMLYTKTITARRTIIAVITPIGLGILIVLLSYLFGNRLLGTLAAAVVGFGLLYRYGSVLPDIAMQWLYAHPRLRPETRGTRPKTKGLDFVYLASVLGIALVVGTVSPLVAMVGVLILTWFRTGFGPTRRTGLAIALSSLGTALHVNANSSLAPGVFYPKHPRVPFLSRTGLIVAAAAVYAPIILMLALSLSAFLPDTAWYLITTENASLDAFNSRMITRSPVWWIEETYRRARDGEEGRLWAFVIALAIGATFPPVVLVGAYWRSITQLWETKRRIEFIEPDLDEPADILDAGDRVEWQWYIDRLKDSPHAVADPIDPDGKPTIRERDHLFLGVQPHSAFPVLLDRRILSEHTYMVGDSGSGKTSLGIMPLLMQLIPPRKAGEGDPAHTETDPIVILDLKGDNALFHLARTRAEVHGREFRFFTPEKGRDSHVFNPMADLRGSSTAGPSVAQFVQLLLDSLGLNHGEGYGRSYYSRQSRRLLLKVIEEAKSPPESIDELIALVEARDDDGVMRDTLELVATLYSLKFYRNIAASTVSVDPGGVIHMPTVLERSQVVYFWLPAAVESASVREIGKLALYSMLASAIARQRDGLPARQAYVFIDEFQRIAAENFKIILEQARSFGLGLVLANQSLGDLRTSSIDLRSAVRTNTRYKRYFSVSDIGEMDDVSKGSGEEVLKMHAKSYSHSEGVSGANTTVSQTETVSDILSIKNMLTPGDLLEIGDHPLDSVVHITRGSGLTQFGGRPLRVRCTWPMPESAYAELRGMSWPVWKDTRPEQPDTGDDEHVQDDSAAEAEQDHPEAADAPTISGPTVRNTESPEQHEKTAALKLEQLKKRQEDMQ